MSTVVFNEGQDALAQEWQQLGRFEALTRTTDGRLLGPDGKQVGGSPCGMMAVERQRVVCAAFGACGWCLHTMMPVYCPMAGRPVAPVVIS